MCVKGNQSVGTKLLLKAVEIRLKYGKCVTVALSFLSTSFKLFSPYTIVDWFYFHT